MNNSSFHPIPCHPTTIIYSSPKSWNNWTFSIVISVFKPSVVCKKFLIRFFASPHDGGPGRHHQQRRQSLTQHCKKMFRLSRQVFKCKLFISSVPTYIQSLKYIVHVIQCTTLGFRLFHFTLQLSWFPNWPSLIFRILYIQMKSTCYFLTKIHSWHSSLWQLLLSAATHATLTLLFLLRLLFIW